MKIKTDDIVSALRRAAYYEAREAELHFRTALRTEMKRRRRTRGLQRAALRVSSGPPRSP